MSTDITIKAPLEAVLQALFIIVLSIMLSLTINYFRSSPMPLIGDWSVKARLTTEAGDSIIVSMEDAIILYEDHAAVFVDARSSEQYAEGHIKGAVSLPWHDYQERFMDVLPKIDPDASIITYCDGETCTLSHDLALSLKDMGFKVKVLVDGWSSWNRKGLPVEVQE